MLRVKNDKPKGDKPTDKAKATEGGPKDATGPKDKKPGDKPAGDKKASGAPKKPAGGAPPMDGPPMGLEEAPMDPMMDAGAPPMGMPDPMSTPIPMEETDAAVSHLMIAQLLLKSYMDGSLPFSAATGGELMNHLQGALDAISMEAPPPVDPMAAIAPAGVPAGPPMPEPPPGAAGGMPPTAV